MTRRLKTDLQALAEQVTSVDLLDRVLDRAHRDTVRRRVLTATAAGVAVLVLLAGVFVWLPNAFRSGAGPSATTATTRSGDVTPSPTAPSPTAPSPTAPSPTAPSPTGRATPSGGPVTYVDLAINGPGTVTLSAAGGEYQGGFDVVVTNRSTPFIASNVFLTVPAGVTFVGSDFGGCAGPSLQAPECYAANVPAGGSRTFHVSLQVSVAPGPTTQTMDGFTIRFEASDNQGGSFPDPHPEDNILAVTLVLPATGS